MDVGDFFGEEWGEMVEFIVDDLSVGLGDGDDFFEFFEIGGGVLLCFSEEFCFGGIGEVGVEGFGFFEFFFYVDDLFVYGFE